MDIYKYIIKLFLCVIYVQKCIYLWVIGKILSKVLERYILNKVFMMINIEWVV